MKLALLLFVVFVAATFVVSILWSLSKHGELDSDLIGRSLWACMAAACLVLVFIAGQFIGGVIKRL